MLFLSYEAFLSSPPLGVDSTSRSHSIPSCESSPNSLEFDIVATPLDLIASDPGHWNSDGFFLVSECGFYLSDEECLKFHSTCFILSVATLWCWIYSWANIYFAYQSAMILVIAKPSISISFLTTGTFIGLCLWDSIPTSVLEKDLDAPTNLIF